MDDVELNDICFDKQDALVFSYSNDLLIKAKAIQNSILPKLNALLEKSLATVESVFGLSVYEENSHYQFWPHFREERKNELKIDYTNAGSGISASRLKIWKKLSRDDKKEVTIIPVHLYYRFFTDGLMLQLAVDNRISQLSLNSFRKLFTALYENIDKIQIIAYELGFEIWLGNEKEKFIPLKNRLQNILKSGDKDEYCFYCTKIYKLPFNAKKNSEIILDFASLFPIYYELLLVAQGKDSQFKKQMIKFESYYLQNIQDATTIKKIHQKIDSKKVCKLAEKAVDAIDVKPGIRYQVFLRDNFRCLSCGASVKDGAILHVDHIVPRSKGGSDTMDNYQTLCQKCNIGKSNKSKIDLRIKNK